MALLLTLFTKIHIFANKVTFIITIDDDDILQHPRVAANLPSVPAAATNVPQIPPFVGLRRQGFSMFDIISLSTHVNYRQPGVNMAAQGEFAREVLIPTLL
ncbi:Uncharacterized protein HZ326_0119 [Fusarium oxysporum f. sp. albedinis]|nr:Uncharacterized protein HZ326_0119 [Fusarium oxysporum f. sp. albedinis]